MTHIGGDGHNLSDLKPFQIVSLLDMLYFFAPMFYRHTVELTELRASVQKLVKEKGHDDFVDLQKYLRGRLSRVLSQLLHECERIKLKDALDRFGRIDLGIFVSEEGHSTSTLGELNHELKELHRAIEHGLFMRRFYVLDQGDDDIFYDETLRPLPELFGKKVERNFKSTKHDVIEAGNCYALARYTACVFHCMRVVEKGLHALVRHLNTKHNAAINFGKKVEEEQWGRITDEIQIALESPRRLKRLNPIPTRDEMRFYATAAKEFEYFNEAWRKDVSHSRKVYDKTSAKSVMEHVQKFMQILADNKLRE